MPNLYKVVLFSMIFIVLIGCNDNSQTHGPHKAYIPVSWDKILLYPHNIRGGIQKILQKNISNDLKFEDLTFEVAQKLDFTHPLEYSNNKPEWRLFLKEGGGTKYFPVNREEWEGFMSISDAPEIIFTLENRVENLGTDKPELIMLVLNMTREACDAITQHILEEKEPKNYTYAKTGPFSVATLLGNRILHPEDFRTLPFIKDTEGYGGCVSFGNDTNRLEYFHVLKAF